MIAILVWRGWLQGAGLLQTDPAVTLEWEVPEGCPDRAAVLGEVETMLGPTPPDPVLPVRATGHIEAAAEGFRLRLTTSSGERTLSASTCQELADAAALIVAIAVDPTVVDRLETEAGVDSAGTQSPGVETLVPFPIPQEAPAPGTVPADGDESSSEDEPPVGGQPPVVPEQRVANLRPASPVDRPALSPAGGRQRPRRGVAVSLQARGGPAFAVYSAITGVLGVAAVLGKGWWRVDVSAQFWLPVAQDSSANPAVGGRFFLGAVGLRGCGQPSAGAWTFPLCTGLDLGAQVGRGQGELTPVTAWAPWVAAAVEAGALWHFASRWELGLRGGPVFPLVRTRFVTDPSGAVYRPPVVAGAITAVIGVGFP